MAYHIRGPICNPSSNPLKMVGDHHCTFLMATRRMSASLSLKRRRSASASFFSLRIPSGNQTWLAEKIPIKRGI